MNECAKILVVDDRRTERELLVRVLRMENFDVMSTGDLRAALDFAGQSIDLVISDLRIGQESGVELLRGWKKRCPETPFILVTGYGNVDSAVESMKLGAADYLVKPVDCAELLKLVKKCLELRHKERTVTVLQERLHQRLGIQHIIGQSPPMREIFEKTRRAALAESTVLITGESGTGKELIAQAIHENSPRRDKLFVTVNMAAVPEHLAESELFGHVKGSFTGATESRVGRFEAAHGGTIFIDEIGDFKRECQAKLLRVLEDRTVTPIGSNDDREVDVRVVAATSRNLEYMVTVGEFREDLFYRLNVINLDLPPLRQRREDIPLLITHFLTLLCQQAGKPIPRISRDLEDYLYEHAWPGNVRQLRNCLECMVVLSSGTTLTLEDLPKTVERRPVSTTRRLEIPPSTSLNELEREAVALELERHGGNRVRAAESLGISVRTLQRKLKAWQLNGSTMSLLARTPEMDSDEIPVESRVNRDQTVGYSELPGTQARFSRSSP